ncbi:MAG: response regulator [Ignavibacteria bacterium]|nr:response regulator [Ignavibacteria bacterium]
MAKILVVEDEELIRDLLKAELTHEGFEVITAENGKDALEKVYDEPPDLIVCDVMMPVMDGFTFQEKLIQDELLKEIPLIFLTAKSDKTDIRFGKSLGAEDYLTKPFEFEDLLVSIRSRLKKSFDRKKYLNQKLDDIRRSILYALPHEFKNPLSTLSGFVSLLQDKDYKKTEEETQEFLSYIQASSDRLNRLVTNFIKLAELEVIHSDDERVKKLRNYQNQNWSTELITFVSDFAHRNNLEIKTEVEGDDKPINFDYNAIQMILSELLSNSIKFSNPENISISVRAYFEDYNFCLSVKDNGKGIEEDALNQITEMFYQHNRKFQEQQGGGLGLTIVNKIVQIYSGKMKIKSKPNKGTEIFIKVPINKS